MFEAVEMFQRFQNRFLNEIGRVGDVPCPAREAAGCPPAKGRDVTREQLVERVLVAATGALEEVTRGLDGIRRIRGNTWHQESRQGSLRSFLLCGTCHSRVSSVQPGLRTTAASRRA